MAKKDAPWQAPAQAPAEEATSAPIVEETPVPAAEEPVVPETETDDSVSEDTTESPAEDLVVAKVTQRYTISLDHHRRVTYMPGNVVMPRAHAESWYSKACGTVIVGVPDTASVTGFPAKQALDSIKAKANSAQLELGALLEKLSDLTKEQTAALTKARDALKNASEQLGSF
jgi:hypothetical protein